LPPSLESSSHQPAAGALASAEVSLGYDVPRAEVEAALLDVTDPEPLPEDHPLWTLDNAQITMHLSGRAQTKMFMRSADRFIENLQRWHDGEQVAPQMDLTLGY